MTRLVFLLRHPFGPRDPLSSSWIQGLVLLPPFDYFACLELSLSHAIRAVIYWCLLC